MFLYNLKINGNRIVKFLFIIMLIIILIIFSIGIYNIFFRKNSSPESNDNSLTLTDTIKSSDVFEITPDNYTNILETVTNDIDSYIGCKIHFSGYIYRLIDFEANEFVLARDMIVNKESMQTLVVGFLCTYDKAYEFEDNTWVDITGTITKGDYYGDIAQVEVNNIFKCDEPENKYVSMPDDTYIPTSNMF